MFSGNCQTITNSDFCSIFHNTTVTANLFEIHLCFQESIGNIEWSVSLKFGIILALFSRRLSNNRKTVIYIVFSILPLPLLTLFEIVQMLPAMHFIYRMYCFLSILVWSIQILQHFWQYSVEPRLLPLPTYAKFHNGFQESIQNLE